VTIAAAVAALAALGKERVGLDRRNAVRRDEMRDRLR
jgi:RimJ/RimL family protein N-acetyltransferase